MGLKPVRSKIFILLEPGKKSEFFFFQEKSGFFGKYRYLSEKSAIFRRFFYFRFFHPKIFSSTAEKSVEKTDFFVHASKVYADMKHKTND